MVVPIFRCKCSNPTILCTDDERKDHDKNNSSDNVVFYIGKLKTAAESSNGPFMSCNY